jgi:long-subunit fatty acid transport protein
VYAGGSIFGGNGLGEPQIAGGARAIGLAGGGLGLRDSISFNTNNPALCAFARTSLYSMSGKLGIWSVKADGETERDGEYSWGDLNLFLPVTGRYKIGLGVVPSMKADLKTFMPRTAEFSNSDTAAYEERIVWKGGTTDIHLDNAYRVNDRLSVGLTVAYSFTNMNRDVTLDFTEKDQLNAAWYETALFKGWWTKIGFFWQPTDRLGVGAYYRPRSGGKWELSSDTNGGIAAVETKRDGETPSAMGGGLSFLVRPRLMMTADVQTQQWKRRDLGILYDGDTEVKVKDPLFVSIGIEKQATHERVGGNMGQWALLDQCGG